MPHDTATPPPAYARAPESDTLDDHRRWQAHVDAGRIGNRPAPDPAIRANNARTARIFGVRE